MACRHTRLAVLLAAALLGGCSQVVVPFEPSLVDPGEKVPVVLVPGVTGTALRDPATGRLVWGDGRALLRPRDRGYALARPVVPAGGRAGGGLELAGVIRSVRLGPVRKEIYGPIVRLLERHGYTAGELDAPRPQDDLFLFGYDWRDENAASARRLAEALEALRRARGVEQLAVDLVCQSNGALVCRWLAKHGGATLEEAEAGGTGPPAGIRVRKLVLVSPSNGGSLEGLVWLTRGRRYVPLIGRRWRPETVATLRSVYEDLPVYDSDLFVDAAGEPLAIDLFDPESWSRYGWSLLSRQVERRVERSGRADLFGDRKQRRTFLGRALDRARRFHRLLRADAERFGGSRYYVIQNVARATPARAVLERRAGGWRLRFLGDRWLERRAGLRRLVVAPGDGHATVASQLWMSPQESRALAAEPARVDGSHFDLILAPEAQRRLLAYLAEGTPPGGAGAVGGPRAAARRAAESPSAWPDRAAGYWTGRGRVGIE